jgi:hypothetical protein
MVRAMVIARQQVAKHIPAEANARKNRTSIARQRRGKHAFETTGEGVFSMGPPRDYISSPVVNQKSVVERERIWQSRKKGLAEDWLWVIVIYFDYEWLYKKVLTNPIIQSKTRYY